MNLEQLQALLNEHDDGILRHGMHKEGREFCALEFESKVRGRQWSDAPITLPDLRPINDGPWSSDTARTTALLPVMAALWDWSEWSQSRRVAWASCVALMTVQQIVSELPGLSDDIRTQCREAKDLTAAAAGAAAAARAASAEEGAAAWAGGAAESAAEAAEEAAEAWAGGAAEAAATGAAGAAAAARAASAEEGDKILLIACAIWIHAAEETRDVR